MPYQPNENCVQPENLNAYIWRFLDLPKFLHLLHSSTLYFCRGDQFDDPYEGMPPDEYIESVRAGLSDLGGVAQWTRMMHYYRSYSYLNCWHLSEHESAAMWKLYGGLDAGIAIRSTYSRLREAFKDCPEPVYVGLTRYGGDSLFGPVNAINFMTHKRKSFEHEREVRAFIMTSIDECPADFDSDAPITLPLPDPPTPKGIAIPVNLHQLVTGVFLSPRSPAWLEEAITATIKRFDFTFSLTRSNLYRLSYVRS